MTTVPIVNPVRKGEVVAVEVEHSYHTARMKRSHYTRFHLATVTHASREGLARKVEMAGSSHSVEVARVGRVLTLNGCTDVRKPSKGDVLQFQPGHLQLEVAFDVFKAVAAHVRK